MKEEEIARTFGDSTASDEACAEGLVMAVFQRGRLPAIRATLASSW
jgi:hypothetical protein